MPDSVQDRPTKAHEYIFLLSKSERYFYDINAVRNRSPTPDKALTRVKVNPFVIAEATQMVTRNLHNIDLAYANGRFATRNKRSFGLCP